MHSCICIHEHNLRHYEPIERPLSFVLIWKRLLGSVASGKKKAENIRKDLMLIGVFKKKRRNKTHSSNTPELNVAGWFLQIKDL